MEKHGSVLMNRYELGRLLGQGTFAKVYHARSLQTGQSVAIKIIDKEKVLKSGLVNQITREISVMRLVRHPNVVQLYEVMASKKKLYFAIEYFQQLIEAVEFCHSRGVYHRYLKPENLLLDENGDLKISDFGLSALKESRRQDGLLHTTCGTPAYVAPEVINKRGYDGAKADIWSCGVILFVLLAGFLPFQDTNLMELYKKITKGEFRCPNWFPNPGSRISISRIMSNPWFRKGYNKIEVPPSPQGRDSSTLLQDVHAAFEPGSPRSESATSGASSFDGSPVKPTSLNAFEIISFSKGFDLSGLFGKDRNQRMASWFTSTKSLSTIMSKFEQIAVMESFIFDKKNGTMKLIRSRQGRKGQLGIDAEIFEIMPSFYVVELKKSAGDTLEYKQFCDRVLRPSLSEIVWAWDGNQQQQQQS